MSPLPLPKYLDPSLYHCNLPRLRCISRLNSPGSSLLPQPLNDYRLREQLRHRWLAWDECTQDWSRRSILQ